MSLACLQKVAAIKSSGRNCPKTDCTDNKEKIFSLVGGIRNIPYIGKSYAVSGKNGCCSNDPSVLKKASLNTKGMLQMRYRTKVNTVTGEIICPRVAFNSQYPNTWVKDTSSEYNTASSYIVDLKRSIAQCKLINETAVDLFDCSSNSMPSECQRIVRQGSRLRYSKDGLYKNAKSAISASEYTSSGLMKKNCLDPALQRNDNPRAAFPFPISGPCASSIRTVSEAVEAGLLPADHINELT